MFPEENAVGLIDGPPDYVFGSLVDAVVLSSGSIAVLDEQYGQLRLFSRSLKPLAVLGGFGDGPGELADPSSVFERIPGDIIVVDRRGRLEPFRWPPHDGGHSSRVLLRVRNSYDACSVGGRLFVMGVRVQDAPVSSQEEAPELIHAVDDQGAIERSFSTPYALVRNPLVADIYSLGHLACDAQDGGRLWAAYSLLGEVHALDVTGRVRWIAKLTDMRYPKYLQKPSGAIGAEPGTGFPIEHISNVALVSSSMLVVQVHSRTLSRNTTARWVTRYHTYVLDPESGKFQEGFVADHEVIGGGDGTVVLYRPLPYPQFAIVRVDFAQ